MINSDLPNHFTLSTQDIPTCHKSRHLQKYPMNNSTKMWEKMDAVYKENKDEQMEDTTTYSSSTTPT